MLGLGSDHVGLELKSKIKEYLDEKGYGYIDFGCFDDTRVDYPVYGYRVAQSVAKGECDRGLLFCGTGVGISLAANKVKGIRALVCSDPYTARLSKEHNNTNILSLGARVVGFDLAKMIIDEWLNTTFEGGRHQKRIDMIATIEDTNKLESSPEDRYGGIV